MLTVVTIGVCVKNNAVTIKEAIDSVIDQDFKEVDIPTKFFVENKGLGFARQLVVDNARGKYILWLDGDLILSKTYVSQQERFMKENPKVGITAGGIGIWS